MIYQGLNKVIETIACIFFFGGEGGRGVGGGLDSLILLSPFRAFFMTSWSWCLFVSLPSGITALPLHPPPFHKSSLDGEEIVTEMRSSNWESSCGKKIYNPSSFKGRLEGVSTFVGKTQPHQIPIYVTPVHLSPIAHHPV